MGWTLAKRLQSVFLDFTIDGERVVTQKLYGSDENGKRYLSERQTTVRETGEVLSTEYYRPGSRKPFATYMLRPYTLS